MFDFFVPILFLAIELLLLQLEHNYVVLAIHDGSTECYHPMIRKLFSASAML
jgi:hypothetical protein